MADTIPLCDPKECHTTASCQRERGLTVFPEHNLCQCPCKTYAIKTCGMMSSSSCLTPSSAPLLLISSLAQSQSTHFPCYRFGTHHYHLRGWTTGRLSKVKEKSVPRLIWMKLVRRALEYLSTREGPCKFNFCNVYVDWQLLLWQKRDALHSSIWLDKVLWKSPLGTVLS